ncbi:hypothetical protein NKH77_19310 [Streptomyces sp. M19]
MRDLPTIRTLTDLRIHYPDSARIPAALIPTVREIVRTRYDEGTPYAASRPRPGAPTAGRTAPSWPPAPRSVAGAAPGPAAHNTPRKGPHGRAVPPQDARLLPGPTTTGSPATSNPATRAATCGNAPTSSRRPSWPTVRKCWPTPAAPSPAPTSPRPN